MCGNDVIAKLCNYAMQYHFKRKYCTKVEFSKLVVYLVISVREKHANC